MPAISRGGRVAGCGALLAFLLLGIAAPPLLAQQFQFRGELVETYLAEADFLDKLPPGTRLNCEDSLCSSKRSVRIYVFRRGETIKKLWSTDYCDVMFDEPEAVAGCGSSAQVAYHDEANQLLYREQSCTQRQARLR